MESASAVAMSFRFARLPLAVFAASLVSFASAKNDDPLKRLVPVPANEPIPAVDFFRPRLFTQPELNPAGTHFAAIISTGEDRLDLIAFDLATKKIERLTGGGDFDIAAYQWINDQRMLFSLTKGKLYAAGLYAVEVANFTRPYVLQRNNVMIPVGFPAANPTQAVVWIRNNAYHYGTDGGIMKLDTRRSFTMQDSGHGSLGDDGLRADIVIRYPDPKGGDPVAYLADRTGELAFGVTQKDGVATMHRFEDGEWKRCPINLKETEVVGVGDRPGELLALSGKNAGKPRGLYRLDATTGVLGELIHQDPQYDIQHARFYRHPVDHHLIGVQYDRKGPQSVWFDQRYREIQDALDRTFSGDVVRILGSDRDEKQFFVSVSSDVRPVVYKRINMETHHAQTISDVVPWIDSNRMQPMRLITYKSRDGFDIEGYVTLPAGTSKENKAPLVVLPHGGPWVRDSWGWEAETQFLASRGYAVFQPNYRGSSGTTWRFPETEMWAFRKMHNDVTDGVRTVLKTGLIDADRLAIMGTSFGGYLALCGAVHEPDLYRCAITIAGVFDWERVIKDAKGSEYSRGGYGLLKRELGDPKSQKEKFEELSPIYRVNQIKIPVFVAHGKDDPVASVAQSKNLLKQLQKFGVAYEKQIQGGEGHGFHQLDHKVSLYTAIEAFLAKNLAKREPPAASTGPAAP
jgi:dipeptidyl aminopeptidase/acylaminoacyl peptidase